MHLQAAQVGGWSRGPQLGIQRAVAVVMACLNFPTDICRVHNKPTGMYIEMDVHMCNESSGVKSRIVYRCFFNVRGSIGHADGIGAGCEHGPPVVRYDPATPLSYEKRKSYECAPLLTGIQLPRISTTVTKVPMTNESFRFPMTKVRRWTLRRGIQVFKHNDI